MKPEVRADGEARGAAQLLATYHLPLSTSRLPLTMISEATLMVKPEVRLSCSPLLVFSVGEHPTVISRR